MSLAERVIELQRFDRRRLRSRKRLAGSKHSILPIAQQGVRVGQATVRLRVVWIALDRLVEILDRLFKVVTGSLVPEIPSLQVRLVRPRIHDFHVRERRPFLRVEIDPDLFGDRARDVVLQRERFAQIAIIGIRPQVLVVARFDQLGRDPNLIARAQHRAFHDGVHVQLARDLRQRLAHAFVRHHRRPRNDA